MSVKKFWICIVGAVFLSGSMAACSSSSEKPVTAAGQAPVSVYAGAVEAMHAHYYNKCIKLATAELDKSGPSVEGLTIRGIAYAKLNKPLPAFQDLLEVTKMDYGVQSLMNLGNAQRSLGYCARAIDAYEHALVLDPGNPYILINMSSAYQCLDELDQANATFVKTFGNLPKDEVAYTNAATFKFEDESYSEALTIAKRAIEIDPSFFPAYKILSYILSAMGDKKGAEEAMYQYNGIRGREYRLREAIRNQ